VDDVPLIRAGDDLPDTWRQSIVTAKVNDQVGGMIVKELPISQTDELGMLTNRVEKVLVHPALAQDPAFDRVVEMMSGSDEFAKFFEKGMQLWKSYATTAGPFTGGFALRNFEGNLINGYWLTNTSPHWYGTGLRLRHQMARGMAEGDPLKYVPAAQRTAARDALDNGVVGGGFYSQELGQGQQIAERLGQQPPSLPRRIGQKVNPLSTDNALLRVGRRVNTALEDGGRLGLFLAKRKGGFSVDDATSIVQDYLFDYSSLSKADQAIKQAVPFWTWTRKNLPLQLETLIKNPGKITTQMHALEAVRQEVEPGTQGTAVPNWMLGQEAIVGGDTAYIPDLPFISTYEQLRPLGTLLRNVRGGQPAEWDTFARELINASGVGGIPGAFLPILYQIAAGEEVFSGRQFRPGETVAGVPSEVWFAIEQLMPGVSKIRRVADPGSRTQAQRIISAFLGQNLYPINDTTRRNEMFRRLSKLDRYRTYLTNKGVTVPQGEYE
jgi:hypothetical protein